MMKRMRRLVGSLGLLAGVGLWVSASSSPAAAASEEPAVQEAAAEDVGATAGKCWECVRHSDCDAVCGAGAGYCQWNGCTRCLCTM